MASLLLTGIPGIGKTTIIRKVAMSLAEHCFSGFVTDEIRTEQGRKGFRLITFDGQEAMMAHVDLRSQYRVGKYRVDVQTIDRLAKTALRIEPNIEFYIIDEIGKMECLSSIFVAGVRSILDSGKPIIASIAKKGEGLISEVKKRQDSVVWEVTVQNRNDLPDSILRWMRDKCELL
jgi:nucleoside-triphosphatase